MEALLNLVKAPFMKLHGPGLAWGALCGSSVGFGDLAWGPTGPQNLARTSPEPPQNIPGPTPDRPQTDPKPSLTSGFVTSYELLWR